MTLEERVTRLEHFVGDMEHISTLYANSVQEICDKYLSLLYVEIPDVSHPNQLVVDGYLGTIGDDPSTVPRNVVFNIRASHDFEDPLSQGSFLVLKRDGVSIPPFPLKKYNIDPDHQGELIPLEEHDFRNGSLYGVYINSQGIAVMTTNDAGDAALAEVRRLGDTVTAIATLVNQAIPSSGELSGTTGDITTINSTTINTTDLNVTNPITLPNGSTCSTQPINDNSSKLANTSWVKNYVDTAIRTYHANFHKIGTGTPESVLTNADEGAIYYQY